MPPVDCESPLNQTYRGPSLPRGFALAECEVAWRIANRLESTRGLDAAVPTAPARASRVAVLPDTPSTLCCVLRRAWISTRIDFEGHADLVEHAIGLFDGLG